MRGLLPSRRYLQEIKECKIPFFLWWVDAESIPVAPTKLPITPLLICIEERKYNGKLKAPLEGQVEITHQPLSQAKQSQLGKFKLQSNQSQKMRNKPQVLFKTLPPKTPSSYPSLSPFTPPFFPTFNFSLKLSTSSAAAVQGDGE